MERVNKNIYYLDIAQTVAERSTCFRRKYGAIIVKNDEIIATGYNGAPRGTYDCLRIGYCPRIAMEIPHGMRYELCRSVHAEANAIISASRRDMVGGTLYLVGLESDTGEIVSETEPCMMCERLIINSGLSTIITRKTITEYKESNVSEYVQSINHQNASNVIRNQWTQKL